jgi:hypothetical protein
LGIRHENYALDKLSPARRDEAVKGAEGKRLYYRLLVSPPVEQPHDGEQLPFWPD